MALQLVETWIMVGAARFVGVPQSTMSMNVCLFREARGRSCLDNFPGSSFFQLTFAQILFMPTEWETPRQCRAPVQAAYAPFIDYLGYLSTNRLSAVPASVIEHHLSRNNL